MPTGAAGGVAAFALTAALAGDNGGFDATTWNLALVAVAAAGLVLVLLDGGSPPDARAAAFLVALAGLTAWTALSYFWSDSPSLAPVEAQRVALYFGVAFTAVLARRRLEPRWVAAGVVAGATVIAAWNIVDRIRGVGSPTGLGALAAPMGYANSLALLCVLGTVLAFALPRPAVAVLPVLVADLALQQSTGAVFALVVAVAFLAARGRARPIAVAVLVASVAAAPFALRGHERTAYWRVAAREAEANPVAGSGAGTFADWWLRERPKPISTKEAHSLYVETVAELGPFGLALVLVVFVLPAAVARRSPLGAAVVAYAVAAAADFHWELAGVTAPAVLVAAVAVSRPRARRSARFAPVFGLLAIAAVLAYAGNERLASAQSALQQNDRAQAAAEARSALRFAPYSAAAWEVIGDATSAPAAYRRGLALDPGDWGLWAKLGAAAKGESRRYALREAARLNPLASGP